MTQFDKQIIVQHVCTDEKSLKYERSADRQSAETRTDRIDGSKAEITAYPIFIMLSAINSSLCIIPVMCSKNVIHFLQYFSIYP